MIYTIILSSSTVADNDAGTVASWTVRGKSILIDGWVTLIESMSIHLAPISAGAQPHSKVIIINIHLGCQRLAIRAAQVTMSIRGRTPQP